MFGLPTSTLSHLWRSPTQRFRCERFGACAEHPSTGALQRLQQPAMLQARLHYLHQVSQRAVYQGEHVQRPDDAIACPSATEQHGREAPVPLQELSLPTMCGVSQAYARLQA